jgi:hypothetical protein
MGGFFPPETGGKPPWRRRWEKLLGADLPCSHLRLCKVIGLAVGVFVLS